MHGEQTAACRMPRAHSRSNLTNIFSLFCTIFSSQRAGAYLDHDHDGLDFDEFIHIFETVPDAQLTPEVEVATGAVGAQLSSAEAEEELRRLLRRGPGEEVAEHGKQCDPIPSLKTFFCIIT